MNDSMFQFKTTKKSINNIINNTTWLEFEHGEQNVQMCLLGYYTPSNANWSYACGIAQKNGNTFLVVKRFGGLVGAIQLHCGDNDKQ